MRCDTKRAIWWDLYNKHISIFCINYMSTIFRTLQVNKWWSKNQTFFSFCEINATKFGSKNLIHLDCITQFQYWCYVATDVCSRKSATIFGDLPDCLIRYRRLRLKHWTRLNTAPSLQSVLIRSTSLQWRYTGLVASPIVGRGWFAISLISSQVWGNISVYENHHFTLSWKVVIMMTPWHGKSLTSLTIYMRDPILIGGFTKNYNNTELG